MVGDKKNMYRPFSSRRRRPAPRRPDLGPLAGRTAIVRIPSQLSTFVDSVHAGRCGWGCSSQQTFQLFLHRSNDLIRSSCFGDHGTRQRRRVTFFLNYEPGERLIFVSDDFESDFSVENHRVGCSNTFQGARRRILPLRHKARRALHSTETAVWPVTDVPTGLLRNVGS